MILAEAEEGRPRRRMRNGQANTIQYHETMAEQFAIFFATRGDNCTGIIGAGDVRDVRPVGMTISISTLRDWHYDLRRGDHDDIGGIGTVKEAVVAAGGSMDALRSNQRTDLTDLPGVLKQYKKMRGNEFDGTVHGGSDNQSYKAIYLRVGLLSSGKYDGQDGIVEIKAAIRRMGFLITDEDFLRMLKKYVDAMGRNGRINNNVSIVGVNCSKMQSYVKKIRSGSDADLKERVDEILGPHPNDREALDALSETLRGRIHSIAGKMGLLSPGVSEDWGVTSDSFSVLQRRCVERFATVSYPFFTGGDLTSSLAPELFQVDGLPEDVLVSLLELMEGFDPSTRPDSEEAAGVVTDLLVVLSYAVCKSSYKLSDHEEGSRIRPRL